MDRYRRLEKPKRKIIREQEKADLKNKTGSIIALLDQYREEDVMITIPFGEVPERYGKR